MIKNEMFLDEDYSLERFSPYRLLWLKVIIRAAYDYALWKESTEYKHRKFADDAEKWLFEESSMEFSFDNICDKFNFPAEKLRSFARNLTKDDVKKLEFRERHGRDPLQSEIADIDIFDNIEDDGDN